MSDTFVIHQRDEGKTVVDQRDGEVIIRDVTLAGTAGASAYQIAVDNGFVGTEAEWLDSLVGPTGPTGGAYEHDQAVPATTWTISHPLPFYPNVTLVDSAGDEFIADIHYAPGVVTVTMLAAQGGKAYLS